MFISYNYQQIRCQDCGTVSHFDSGEEYKVIECSKCQPYTNLLKELHNGKSRKTSTKNTKKVQ